MNVITKRTIVYYTEQYPSAKTALLTWLKEFSSKAFISPNELKEVYGNASIVANHRVVFNIKGNDFRLVISVNLEHRLPILYGLELIGNMMLLMLPPSNI